MKDNKYRDLYAMLICTIIAIVLTPLVYNFIFIEPFWYLKFMN